MAVEPGDADVLARWLELLGIRRTPVSVVRLADGQSGAAVFLLEGNGERHALKVTTDAAWRTQAVREVRFYEELGPKLPIAVPELRAAAIADEGVGLLLSGHGPRARAIEWSLDLWIEAAAEAGRLHRHGRSAGTPRWLHRVPPPRQVAVARAVAQWKKLGQPVIAEQLVELVVEASDVWAKAEPTIVHGDCHVENLLPTDDGGLVWVDWQQVATGAGPEDLALLWQRAEFDGARPPRSEMITAYRAAVGAAIAEPFERLVLAAELRLLLLEWPHFLPYGDAGQQETMLTRLREVQHRWVD